jgi:hypothetical protein
MTNGVFYCAYNLKKGADVQEFLSASERLNNEYISKQKGNASLGERNA